MADKKVWFRHDVGSINDIRMQRVMRKYGMIGIGIYWCLIEALYTNDGKLFFSEVPDLAFTLHTEPDVMLKIGKDRQIFESDAEGFWSNRVNEELELQKDISEKAKRAIKIRWENQKKAEEELESDTSEESEVYDRNTTVLPAYNESDTSVIHRQTDRQTEKTDRKNTCPEPAENTASVETEASPSPVFIELPAIGSPSQPKKVHKVTNEDLDKYHTTYPAVDVEQELRQMAMWLEANPSRKKSNTRAFIVNWLKKSQDRSGSPATNTQYQGKAPIPHSVMRTNDAFAGRTSGNIEF